MAFHTIPYAPLPTRGYLIDVLRLYFGWEGGLTKFLQNFILLKHMSFYLLRHF
jgi:hypothetical protein